MHEEQSIANQTSAPKKSKLAIGLGVVSLFVLAAASIYYFGIGNDLRATSRDQQRVADMKDMQSALDLYFADHASYPPVVSGYPSQIGAGDYASICEDGFKGDCGDTTTYLKDVPTQPTPADGECTDVQNRYIYNTNGTLYALFFCLGSQVGDLPPGPHTAIPGGIR